MLGNHNITNATAAIAIAINLGIGINTIKRALKKFGRSLYENDEDPLINALALGTPQGDIKVEADKYLAACDVPGIKKLIPEEWRRFPQFAAIDKLEAVPVATVQLRYDGWVTELKNQDAQFKK